MLRRFASCLRLEICIQTTLIFLTISAKMKKVRSKKEHEDVMLAIELQNSLNQANKNNCNTFAAYIPRR